MTKKRQRILVTARLFLISTARGRADYLRKKGLFGKIGENVVIQPRKLPLYSKLIYIHNNVKIASNVEFITHDIIYKMLNDKNMEKESFVERMGCIEINDNVFIGSGTKIMYNTRIGYNVIIGAGSLVTKDIPDNSVYGGVPAKYICSFDEYVKKAERYSEEYSQKFKKKSNSEISRVLYNDFVESRKDS